jgi:fission process protein 1
MQGQKRRHNIQVHAQTDSQTECKPGEKLYPKYETSAEDDDFLPKRKPGDFADVSHSEHKASSNGSHSSVAVPAAAATEASGAAEYDPLRDGPLRYLGYANECGEAFAAWLPAGGVPFSYAVAIAYVLTDTADKGSKAYKAASKQLSENKELSPEVNVPRLVNLLAFERTLDTVVWQLLASVACPGYTIHTVVALFHAALQPLEETAQAQQLAASAAASLNLPAADILTILDKSLPTAVGLAVIPFIVHPIDNGIHALMNFTLRPAMRKYICGPGQGDLAQLDMCAEEECIPGQATSGSSQNHN